jgi:hypothetical protein
MSQLFLASSFDITIGLFLAEIGHVNGADLRVGFIDIAADPYKKDYGDLPWVKDDLDAFLANGFEISRVDLRVYWRF